MTLADYIAASRGTASDLARKLGVSPSTVSRWAHGKMAPPLAMAARIERATDGAVTVRDLMPVAEAA